MNTQTWSVGQMAPMFVRKVVRFTNQEVLIEAISLNDDGHGKRVESRYLALKPSGVALASGWASWENPRRAAGHVVEEVEHACDILQSAFPEGPGALGKDWRTAEASVTEYVYPLGERMERKPVKARRAGDGRVEFSYNGEGEPIGAYEIKGVWNPARTASLRDDIPVSSAGTADSYKTLGQARAGLPTQ